MEKPQHKALAPVCLTADFVKSGASKRRRNGMEMMDFSLLLGNIVKLTLVYWGTFETGPKYEPSFVIFYNNNKLFDEISIWGSLFLKGMMLYFYIYISR